MLKSIYIYSGMHKQAQFTCKLMYAQNEVFNHAAFSPIIILILLSPMKDYVTKVNNNKIKEKKTSLRSLILLE